MKIFVTRKTPGKSLEKLAATEHEVVVSEFDRPLKEEELVEKVKDADALLTLLTDRVDGALMDAAGPQLKIISKKLFKGE